MNKERGREREGGKRGERGREWWRERERERGGVERGGRDRYGRETERSEEIKGERVIGAGGGGVAPHYFVYVFKIDVYGLKNANHKFAFKS